MSDNMQRQQEDGAPAPHLPLVAEESGADNTVALPAMTDAEPEIAPGTLPLVAPNTAEVAPAAASVESAPSAAARNAAAGGPPASTLASSGLNALLRHFKLVCCDPCTAEGRGELRVTAADVAAAAEPAEPASPAPSPAEGAAAVPRGRGLTAAQIAAERPAAAVASDVALSPSASQDLQAKKFRTLEPLNFESLNKNRTFAQSEPAGVYLVYNSRHEGSWQAVWSKEFVEGAWAFGKPGKEVAAYHYRGPPAELAAGINSSTEKLASGVVEFFKLAVKNRCSLRLLNPHHGKSATEAGDDTGSTEESTAASDSGAGKVQPFFIAVHADKSGEVRVLREGLVPLSGIDAAGCAAAKSRSASNLAAIAVPGQRVPTHRFVAEVNVPGGFATTVPMFGN